LLGVLFALVLVLPILMVGIGRVYENQLIRNTEEILIAEAVVIGEVYRRAIDPSAAEELPAIEDPDAERFFPFRASLDINQSALLPRAERENVEVATSSITSLTRLLERTVIRTLSGVRVLDARGLVVASPTGETGYSLAHLPEVASALRGEYSPALRQRFSDEPAPALTSLSRAAGLRVSIAIPVYADPRTPAGKGGVIIGVVYNVRTPLEVTRALWLLRWDLAMPALVSLSITLFLAAFVATTIARPLTKLRRAAESVARGEREGSLDVGSLAPAEIIALSESLAKMRKKLEARAEYIREFAANTAHELKTPLTSLRGASELLLEEDGEMSAEQRRRFLSNINSDAVRMDQLVQRILHLARIESQDAVREEIDLYAFLEGTAERYRRMGHDIELVLHGDRRTVRSNVELLDSLVTNLLDNAVRHGAGLRVTIAAKDGVLSVRDRGPKMPASHFARVFERFYTTERGRGGTGLGLAIVKAIAEAHEGRVWVEQDVEAGATFYVDLVASSTR
jgi:signal transduction histidine kinase